MSADDETPAERPKRKRHPSMIPGAVPSAGGGVLVPENPSSNEWAEAAQEQTDPGLRRRLKKYGRRQYGMSAILATALTAAITAGVEALKEKKPATIDKLTNQVNDHEFRLRKLESVFEVTVPKMADDISSIRRKLDDDAVFKWTREHKR